MSGRPVRRRVLTEVEQAGGWRVALARIASGEPVAEIARSFGVSRSFFSRLLHEDGERHALVVEAQLRADADALLLDAVEMIGGFGRPDAARLRAVLGERAATLDRATLATVNRLRVALEGGGDEPSAERLGELLIASARAQSRKPPPLGTPAAVQPEVSGAATPTAP